MQAAAAHQLVNLTPLLTAATQNLLCGRGQIQSQLLYNAPLHQGAVLIKGLVTTRCIRVFVFNS